MATSGPGFYRLLALPLLHDYILPGKPKEKHSRRAAGERPPQPCRARPAEFPDSGSQTVESLPHRARSGHADSRWGSCPPGAE